MWALLPVKDFKACKSRLATMLPEDARQSLMGALLADLLAHLHLAQSITDILVVTRCPTASALATQHGATVFSAIDDTGLNEAVTAGITHLTALGASEAFIMHADLPMATAADIDNVIQAHHRQHCALTLVPDNQCDGTNGILLSLPTQMQFFYGKNSYPAHLAFSTSANISTQTVANVHIGCDIDLWDDFRPLFSLASNTQQRTHLAHWLGQYGKLFEWPLASHA